MTVGEARSILGQIRLRFGDERQIAMVRLLSAAERLMETLRSEQLEHCPLCRGAGEIHCESCRGLGECTRCGRDCEDCDGSGMQDCRLCGGTGKPVVSQQATAAEVLDALRMLEARL
ncbi:hypothetical protein [Candidatus Roseilinea sp. NK_OTU-006]|jgi:DnaJ-class molecular chaperone|uniref:hypothetical protein n=1 Tax=Candidatus Roseilinea sp. NK_OTU-006 TaxID=2704250 RepID=UPI00145F3774|nr:hypothetical protein [Candidatus Roseilinea sp. NK_OTU-006]